jgi:hypothetical protein
MDWWLLLVPATFTLAAITTYAIVFRSLSATENPAAWGAFGDFIGGLMNPLVSVLTLFVAISVWRLQKAELELTRGEMAATKEAMEDQARTSEQQRREQRFFDLLNLYKETVNTIEYRQTLASRTTQNVITSNGKQALGALINQTTVRAIVVDVQETSPYPSRPEIDSSTQFLALHLGQYFRVVFRLLQEAERMLSSEHFRYVKLFRAQLSRNEIALLTFNLLYNLEGKGMESLVCQYGLLKHLHDCPLRRSAERLLPPAAFGRTFETASRKVLADTHAH